MNVTVDKGDICWTSPDGEVLVTVDPIGEIAVNGQWVRLTKSRRKLLAYLASGDGMVRSKRMLMRCLYPLRENEAEIKIIDVHMCKIRDVLWRMKIGAEECVRSVWGRGYAFGFPSSARRPICDAIVPNAQRWTPSRKLRIVALLEDGELTREDVLAHYTDLSDEELNEWVEGYARYEERGLKSTMVQECVL